MENNALYFEVYFPFKTRAAVTLLGHQLSLCTKFNFKMLAKHSYSTLPPVALCAMQHIDCKCILIKGYKKINYTNYYCIPVYSIHLMKCFVFVYLL